MSDDEEGMKNEPLRVLHQLYELVYEADWGWGQD